MDMRKSKTYEFIGKSVWIPEIQSLVISDLHIGFEGALEQSGVFLPRQQYKQIIEELEEIFKEIGERIREIIILGDLKHEFGKINQQEWKETLDFMDFLGEKTNKAKIILIKGNHDTILGPLAERRGMEIKDYYIKSGFGFLHGNKQFPEVLDKEIKTLFVGHFHPAITLSEGVKKEKYKCFLEGKWGSKQIVILPSFFPFVEGADVEIDKTNLDFKFNLKKFKVFIPVKGREVLEFGTVKKGGKLNL